MASGDDGEGKSSWWGWDNIVKAAKEKTISTLETVKSDFNEFKTIMTNDTTNLINSATAQLVEKSNTASFLLDSFDNKVKIETSNRLNLSATASNRYENELKAIQLDENIYLSDPEEAEEFTKWKESFNPDDFKATVSDLLIENSSMHLIYSKLVPAQLSNDQFWCRYFYRINIFEEEQKKRIKLLERVKEATNMTTDETVNWDEDDSDNEDDKTINESPKKVTDENNEKEPEVESNENESSKESKVNSVEDEISSEIEKIVIDKETKEIVTEIKESLEDVAKTNPERSMERSINREDSDDWDKLDSDTNDATNNSDKKNKSQIAKEQTVELKAKAEEPTQEKESTKSNKDAEVSNDNSEDWDDWGE